VSKQTNTEKFLGELNGGVFEQQIGAAITDVASGVAEHGKGGKVTITLDFSRIGDSAQVKIKHKLSYSIPTLRGSRSEEVTTETPMHVNPSGSVSMFPENQTDMFRQTAHSGHHQE
jgi:hypothetical protein